MSEQTTTTTTGQPVTVSPEAWEAWLVARVGQLRADGRSAIIFYDAQTKTLRIWAGNPAGQIRA